MCINVIRGAHNLMHKQRNLNDSLLSFMVEEGPSKKNGFQTGSTTITKLKQSAIKKSKAIFVDNCFWQSLRTHLSS